MLNQIGALIEVLQRSQDTLALPCGLLVFKSRMQLQTFWRMHKYKRNHVLAPNESMEFREIAFILRVTHVHKRSLGSGFTDDSLLQSVDPQQFTR